MSKKNTEPNGDDRFYQAFMDKKSIVDGISDPLMVLDTKTYRILDVNKAFQDTYKINSDQVLGKTCYEITHQRNSPCPESVGNAELCPLKETVMRGAPVSTEHIHKDQKGNNVYVEITAHPLMDATGEVFRVVHLAKDVTERRLAEETLKEKVTKSEHLAALGQLVAEITHEIKNPLLMIGGFAKQLFRPVDEATKKKKLTIITEEVARLEKLLKELREYYLPKDPDFQAVNVKEMMQRLYPLVKNECGDKDIEVELILDKEDLTVNWDPCRLEQVFINIIKNSIEAVENKGKLSIYATLSDDKVKVVIKDDGCGIPKVHLDKITDCFFTTKSYGTGLGLCNSKKYIDQHEGSSFSIESEEGKGTTFTITLPRKDPNIMSLRP
ncbi:Sporulation kinase E family protein [delta proteobacterium NaphS2]|nr:Sporulation kinase E family protein [delta proteobacterium NaphS2]